RMLDLDGDEGLGVGLLHVIGELHRPETAIDAGGIDAAHPERMEPGPLNDLASLSSAADLGGHDAAGPGLERPHHRGIVGRGQPDETVDAADPRRSGRLLDLVDGQPGVVLVEPDSMTTAVIADPLYDLRMTE